MITFILDTIVAGMIFRLLLGALTAYLIAKTAVYLVSNIRTNEEHFNENEWRD